MTSRWKKKIMYLKVRTDTSKNNSENLNKKLLTIIYYNFFNKQSFLCCLNLKEKQKSRKKQLIQL